MSYILDALKKAEHQRDIGRVPGIGSGEDAATAGGLGRRWAWVLLVILSLNAVLLVVVLWPEPEPLRQAEVPTLPPAASVPERRTVPARQPVVSRAAPDVISPAPAPAPVAPVPLRPLPPLPAPPVERPAVAATEARTMTIPSAPAAGADGGENLPVWPQVSDQLFREIGDSLHLDVHVYSDEPGERFVLINMRKYHETEKLQEGPVVDAITPGGVILSLHGQRFRMLSQ